MTPYTDLKFGEMEFGEMKRNTSNWSNFCMLPRRAGLIASAGLSCYLSNEKKLVAYIFVATLYTVCGLAINEADTWMDGQTSTLNEAL